ncbi:iron complex transport system permease protein [Litorimonas taeanensis]|uniref:Iron complex transport system permease protein n=1 Tax=Litorimonas taeanensis TaxID=568099 RepID=A0A420WDD2_9PROT|nr:iron ABC transporter permease [Litorimonas taeanensis]RKQ68988.1 iron complex transport system permease protein [Litorimonas taeanensis]
MRNLFLFFGLIIGTAILIYGALFLGSTALSPRAVWLAVMGQGDPLTQTIITEVRLPRLLLALCIGAGLGGSGAALQGYTRNDLAAPGLLGFSACAALGAVCALYFGQRLWITPAAILGALIGAGLIFTMTLAKGHAGESSGQLILAGIGIGALATALTGLLMNLAPNPWALSEIVYWMMGSLDKAHMDQVWICAGFTLLGLLCLTFTGAYLKSLSLGEETAKSLGVNLRFTQALIITGTALCVGSGVAVAGAIGFVGLFIPHIMRFLIGPNPARLIPFSALAGGLFLLLTDTAIRVTSGPGTPLYLGVVTALIGVPFFLYLAMRAQP